MQSQCFAFLCVACLTFNMITAMHVPKAGKRSDVQAPFVLLDLPEAEEARAKGGKLPDQTLVDFLKALEKSRYENRGSSFQDGLDISGETNSKL